MRWIKNTKGEPSATLTFSTIAFAVAMFKVISMGLSIELLGKKIEFGLVDASIITALLLPTFGAYVFRRWSGDKKETEEESTPEEAKLSVPEKE